MTPLRYSPDVERVAADEPELFEEIARTFIGMADRVATREGRAMRPSHAKATAVLRGGLVVEGGLPDELRQGLPAQEARSDARNEYAERLSFRPANSLAAHRPLGQIMRARLHAYGRLADWRRARNGAPAARPDREPVPG